MQISHSKNIYKKSGLHHPLFYFIWKLIYLLSPHASGVRDNRYATKPPIKPRRPGDIATCYCNPAKAEAELGWKAQFGIEEMCRDSWNWQKDNPDAFDPKKYNKVGMELVTELVKNKIKVCGSDGKA